MLNKFCSHSLHNDMIMHRGLRLPRLLQIRNHLRQSARFCATAQNICGEHVGTAKNAASQQIDYRSAFVEHFSNQQDLRLVHNYHRSSRLLPAGGSSDYESLNFVNSGVHQFLDRFVRRSAPQASRCTGDLPENVVNYQKCMRFGGYYCDSALVGKSGTHLMFFEMLGAWSFGRYNIYTAVDMVLDFLIEKLNFSHEDVVISIYSGCEELGIMADGDLINRIIKCGIKESNIRRSSGNIWQIAPSGIFGPSIEIFIKDVEVCTIVNITNWRDAKTGQISALDHQNFVDIGIGLERLEMLHQNLPDVFATRYVEPFTRRLRELLDCDSLTPTDTTIMNITCDRIRALIMCLTDGIYPGISGRNYYVKLMAKSLLNDIRCKLHLKMPQFLSKFVPVFHEVFSESYGCHMWQTRDQLEWICDRVESDTLRSIQKSCNDNDSIQISQHYEQQSEPKDDNRLLPRTIVSDYPAVVNRLLRHLEARFCDDFHLEIQKCVECCDTKEMWISFCCTPILHSRYNNITATRFLASETGQNSGGESNRRDRIFCKRHLESRCRLTECKFYHCSDATKSRINAELDEIKNLSHNITKTVKDFSEKDRLRSKEQDCRRLVRFSTEKTGTFSYKLRLVLDK